MERTQIGLLLAKIESTYATDPVPTGAANVIATTRDGLSFAPGFTRLSRKLLDGTLSRVTGKNVLPRVVFNFRTELRGNRTDGSAADISQGSSAHAVEIDPLLLACDLAATYTVESSGGARDGFVIYKPTNPSDQGNSVTFYWYSGLKLHKITGCKGTFKLTAQAGEIAFIDWTFSGLYNAPTDASIPSPTWLNTVPPIFISSGSQIGATSPIFQKLELDLGNTVTERQDANSTDGMKGFLVTDRASKATIDPESVAVATSNFWDDLYSVVNRTVIARIGLAAAGGSGNRMNLTLVGEPEQEAYGDRSGNRTHQINYELCRANNSDTVNSELQLKFS